MIFPLDTIQAVSQMSVCEVFAFVICFHKECPFFLEVWFKVDWGMIGYDDQMDGGVRNIYRHWIAC